LILRQLASRSGLTTRCYPANGLATDLGGARASG
jgi:hypothetical protein